MASVAGPPGQCLLATPRQRNASRFRGLLRRGCQSPSPSPRTLPSLGGRSSDHLEPHKGGRGATPGRHAGARRPGGRDGCTAGPGHRDVVGRAPVPLIVANVNATSAKYLPAITDQLLHAQKKRCKWRLNAGSWSATYTQKARSRTPANLPLISLRVPTGIVPGIGVQPTLLFLGAVVYGGWRWA